MANFDDFQTHILKRIRQLRKLSRDAQTDGRYVESMVKGAIAEELALQIAEYRRMKKEKLKAKKR